MNRFYLFVMAALLSTSVLAENKQTVTVNGQVVGKTVTEMTFDGGNVVLHYSDGSSAKEDMSLVKLTFVYENATNGIHQVENAQTVWQGKVYNLNGQLVGTSTDGLVKGVYIVNGKKVIIK